MARSKRGLRLNQVILHVKDIDRSKEFYSKRLGFKVQYDYSPQYVALLTPNRLQIGLAPAGKISGARTKDQPVGIEFAVDNVDAWYERLRKKGVRFSERPKNSPWGGEREASFRDPDGYKLEISGPLKSKSSC